MNLAVSCRGWFLVGLACVILCTTTVMAEETAVQPPWLHCDGACPLSERETLTNNWFGLGERLEECGISANLSLTQIYQINTYGGLSTHRRSGRYTGSYDLELGFDLEKMLGLPGLTAYTLAEGGWSEGIDPSSVGSLFNVNADAVGYRSLDVTELWFQQQFFDGRIRIRAGKIDLTGGFECRGCPVSFDGNTFANDETTQFLNGSLVNNPTIPFPDNGLGAVVYVEPLEWWYLSAGVADALADARTTGFNTAFHGPAHFFSIYETGVTPRFNSATGELQGAYRIGLWYDPQPKERFNGGVKRDDLGFYVSADQMLFRESAEDDFQGLGVFARYGWTDGDVNEIRHFWSVGTRYQGLLPGRIMTSWHSALGKAC